MNLFIKFKHKNLNSLNLQKLPDFNFLLCKIENNDLEEALYIAENKSKFTMNYNQNGEIRTQQTKFNNQLQGCLAEIGIQQYLTNLGFHVVRYDEIRTDNFKSLKGEFDLKIILPNEQELFIESRSSKFYDIYSMPNQPIIGKYQNQVKQHEKDNDLFFKSLFYIRDKNRSLLDNLNVKRSFIISGGCTLQDFKQHGYIGNLGQNNTKYNLLKITKENEMNNFEKTLLNILEKQQLNLNLENNVDINENNKNLKSSTFRFK